MFLEEPVSLDLPLRLAFNKDLDAHLQSCSLLGISLVLPLSTMHHHGLVLTIDQSQANPHK
jgi:hypothetical protein